MSSIGDIQNTVFDPANAAIRTTSSGSAQGGSAAGTSTSIQGGVYNATPPTYADGNATQNQSDVNGNQKVTLATAIAGEDIPNDVLKVENRYGYFPIITTQTTTTWKTGVGFLHNIIIPTPVASATVDFYDNTAGSGTKIIPTITLPVTLVSDGPISLLVDSSFSVGCTVVTAGATMGVGGTGR